MSSLPVTTRKKRKEKSAIRGDEEEERYLPKGIHKSVVVDSIMTAARSSITPGDILMSDQSGDPHQRRSISEPLTSGRSKIWSAEEDRDLLKQAGMRWKAGMLKKELVKALGETFKHRSAEAIRKRLQKLKWPTTQEPGVESPVWRAR